MLLKWAGGKSWLTKNHPQIFHSEESASTRAFQNLPSIEFNNYIEPFLGGGAVFKYLRKNQLTYFRSYKNLLVTKLKLYLFILNSDKLFMTFQSLEMADKKSLNYILRWIDKRLS